MLLSKLLTGDDFDQVVVCQVDAGERHVRHTLARVRRLLGDKATVGRRLTVVITGNDRLHRALIRTLTLSGLRGRIDVISHLAIPDVPVGPGLVKLCSSVDLVVVDSAFAARALAHACRANELESPRAPVIIPPAVAFNAAALSTSDDSAAACDELFIGTIAEDEADPTAFEALQIFRLFAVGGYWSCDDCLRVTPFPLDHVLAPQPVATCDRCQGRRGRRGVANPDARLMIFGNADTPATVGVGLTAFTVREACDALSLGRQVVFAKGVAPPRPDAWLIPHRTADLSERVLIAATSGVPVVTTAFGAAATDLPRTVSLIEPLPLRLSAPCSWRANMDAGAAIAALLTVRDGSGPQQDRDAELRAWASQRQPDLIRARWHDALATVAESKCVA